MPPELSALWIADCASASQFDDVLEAIAGVEAMVERRDAPVVEAAGVVVLALEVELPDAEEDEDVLDGEFGDGGL